MREDRILRGRLSLVEDVSLVVTMTGTTEGHITPSMYMALCERVAFSTSTTSNHLPSMKLWQRVPSILVPSGGSMYYVPVPTK